VKTITIHLDTTARGRPNVFHQFEATVILERHNGADMSIYFAYCLAGDPLCHDNAARIYGDSQTL
jgi:hypothetical protein